ncbi:MAG: hypothetical protein WCH76_01025 [Candidatus Riflemargulisbacteria bacterium]
MGDAPGSVPGSTTNKANYKSVNKEAAKSPNSVDIGLGGNVVTFNVNGITNPSNSSFGQSSKNPNEVLANRLFPKNSNVVELFKQLEQLSNDLAAAGIESADIAVVDGKVQITNLKEKGNPFPFSALDKFMANRISLPEDAKQSDITLKLVMSIMSMASEAKSDLIKMIIKSMNDNRKMWMKMLKDLASSDANKKMEAKALLVKLMSTMASRDPDVAKEISSLLSLLGITVVIDNKEINTPMMDEEFNKIKAQYAPKATSSINDNNSNLKSNNFAERYIRDLVKVIPFNFEREVKGHVKE